MHDTALRTGRLFFEIYGSAVSTRVVEIGAMDVNGGLRSACPEGIDYVGVDMAAGPSVDLVVSSGAPLPFGDGSVDCVLSSSQLEHDDFFWMTFLEMVRIVRPGGYIYINAPSNGHYHRFPNDNWRFYPDCGQVLARWARSQGQAVELFESFVADRGDDDFWCDFVAVFAKGACDTLPSACIADQVECRNVWKYGASEPERMNPETQDVADTMVAGIRVELLEKTIHNLRQQLIQHGIKPVPATTLDLTKT